MFDSTLSSWLQRLALSICLLLSFGPALAQTGPTAILRGRVTAAGGRPLELVSVALAGTTSGTTTNAAGAYELPAAAGPHEVVFSFVGFGAKKVAVMLQPGQPTTLNAVLQPTAASLQEVVVTGMSRATELRRSPVPVAVLSRREISLNSGGNVIDAAVRGVPGLSAVTTGPNISKPFIRGLGYNRVLTLYNGLRQEGQQWGDEHGIEIDQYDIDRIEVVKGPASLIYGSDAVAGVINMLPRLPSGPAGQLRGEALSEYQTNNNLIGNSLALNYNQRGWQYAARASYRLAQAYRNALDGRVFGTAFQELNLTTMAGVEKPWGSTHIYATLYDNRQEIPDGSRDSLSRRFTRQVFEGDQDDLKNRPIVPQNGLSTYRINVLHQRIQHYRLLSRTRVRLGAGGGELNALLGGQHNVRREYNHPTASRQAGLAVALTTYNYDLRYAAPTWQCLETTLGLNGMHQANQNQDATDFPIPDYTLFDVGGYVFVKRNFGKLDLSGGLRYDTRTLQWADFYVEPNPATGFDRRGRAATAGGAAPQFAAFRTRYRGLSASVGAAYNLSERLVLRANVARGYRAPNITEVGSNGLDPGAHIVYLGNRSFGPEFSLQEDLGLSAYLPDAEVSVSGFNNYIDNYIYQARLTDADGQPVVIVPGNATYQYQQGRAQLYGAEATVNLHPQTLPGLEFNNSLAYVTGLNREPALLETNGAAARYLPFIPPLRTRSEVRYSPARAVGPLTQTYVRAVLDYNAAQSRFYALDNTETRTAGYALLGLGAGATFTAGTQRRERCQLFVQLDNVLNISYQSHLNRLKYFEYYAASPNSRSGIYNMGRNLSVKLTVPF
ncbi:iron complex outermembrane recepter protein [Hymenobacter daecheongensis DSM 21074]|uniref:Iron complex outermembrane recepter protein n=1 Tax=Hymenobacter daecheongensis DSM 21074 TaxID=1121955 RepID=A0A1M6LJ31_9BACT|nr:TonB-dependent receptor [Hymenobacter daecheongensis]SHJ71138.1 iron complex outermembrane recepter protein [Hymenobacter daecheongensis DSM 21074]